jgi:hypothetical protein
VALRKFGGKKQEDWIEARSHVKSNEKERRLLKWVNAVSK